MVTSLRNPQFFYPEAKIQQVFFALTSLAREGGERESPEGEVSSEEAGDEGHTAKKTREFGGTWCQRQPICGGKILAKKVLPRGTVKEK